VSARVYIRRRQLPDTDGKTVALSTIPREQAERLPNYTSPVPNHEDQYIIQLDVFHQLHCLVSSQSKPYVWNLGIQRTHMRQPSKRTPSDKRSHPSTFPIGKRSYPTNGSLPHALTSMETRQRPIARGILTLHRIMLLIALRVCDSRSCAMEILPQWCGTGMRLCLTAIARRAG
jgi:hypothetical protein